MPQSSGQPCRRRHPRPLAAWTLIVASGIAIPGIGSAEPAAESADVADGSRDGRSRMAPPNPRASPDDLLAYVERIADVMLEPESRGRLRFHRRKVATYTVAAADGVLAQVRPDDPRRTRAVTLKLEALETLKDLGEPRIAAALGAFAASLAADRDPAIAARARRLAVEADVEAVLAGNRPSDAVPLVRQLTAMLQAAPDDQPLLRTAASLATRLEAIPGGDPVARLALEAFIPFLERADDPGLQATASAAAGTLRRLSLPGKPMELEGTLLDGTPFDPATLAGKVVLVDFWATWCGPCVAEIPHVRELYRRYKDRGFEVVGVSLDEDREALEAFVAEQQIPWPIIVDVRAEDGGRPLLAGRYGISGIPTMILVGRDGRVVNIDARGRRLQPLLAEVFPEREPRPRGSTPPP
jgi:thiol-disulfide isomerase/thioredoxin